MTATTLHAFILKAMLSVTVCACFVASLNPLLAQEVRNWVDSTGQFKIEATYQKLENGKVYLKLTNGDLKQIPLTALSSGDQDYVKDLLNPPSTAETPSVTPSTPVQPADTSATEASPAKLKPTAMPPSMPVVEPTEAKTDSEMAAKDATESPSDLTAEPSDTDANSDTNDANIDLPEPIIFYGKRIGDLDVNKIEPPSATEGFRPNPKYLFKVKKEEIALLPREFQGAAILLFQEPEKPREAIPALEFLKVRWPRDRHPTLIKLVINCVSSDQKFNREAALKILADRDPDQSFPYIFARVDDTSFTIRSLAYQMLRKVGDRRAIKPLAKRFASDDVDRISSLLRSFGSDSEDAVAKYLSDEDPDIRLKACNLIGKIGTVKSLPALEAMQRRETTMMLLAQTRSSINKIERRNQSQSQ